MQPLERIGASNILTETAFSGAVFAFRLTVIFVTNHNEIMEADPNIMPDMRLHPLRRMGRALMGFCSLHQLASHGDHFVGADEMLLEEPTELALFTENISGAGGEYTWTYPDVRD